MKKFSFLLVLAIGFVFIQSCEKDSVSNPDNEVAPNLPPKESFIMPLAFEKYEEIDTTGKRPEVQTKSAPTTFRNWFYAGANLVAWNVFIGATTAIPALSFGEAFNHRAVYEGDGVFVWSYDFNAGADQFVARLSGQFINDDEVEWVMKISKVGGFTDVTWYSGIVARDGSQATWTLNSQPENPQPALRIDYQKESGSDDFSLRYTNIISGDSDNGHYIEFRTQDEADFNRAYDVFRGNDNFLQIQWDEPSFNGRVKHFPGFDDDDWHCWNENQRDVDC